METLEQLRNKLKALLEERVACGEEWDDLLADVAREERSELTDNEVARISELRSKISDMDAAAEHLRSQIAELEDEIARRSRAEEDLASLSSVSADEKRQQQRKPGAKVEVREPEIYDRRGQFSFFRDLVAASHPGGGDLEARERLMRDRELRANMNRTDGTGGEFVPPKWMIDEFIALARAGRVTADRCRRLPLPSGTDTIAVPRVATGTAVAEQSDGASVQKTDMTTSSVSAAVTTIAGQQVFALQLLDQSPVNVDEIVLADLAADYAAKLDSYVLNKASIGILNTAGINSVTYTDASPTVGELVPKIADAIQRITGSRFLPPEAIVMHPRRWGWFLAAVDTAGRPLVVPTAQAPSNAVGVSGEPAAESQVGSIMGLPVFVDANIPTNLGGGTNEDRIIVARFSDAALFEGDVRSRVLFETDADTLSVRIQLWNYVAFTAARYPAGISVISGTGLATPTF